MTNQVRDLTTIDTITPRQLRKVLFYLMDQDETIGEVRIALFDNTAQDVPVQVGYALSVDLGLEEV